MRRARMSARSRSGSAYRDLTATARADLERLIRHYLDRVRPDVAVAEWERIVDAGLDEVSFAWAGPEEPGRGHYYAVRGPSLLIEYDNTQNGANHIHAVWRDLANDWGEDLLARHSGAAPQKRTNRELTRSGPNGAWLGQLFAPGNFGPMISGADAFLIAASGKQHPTIRG